MRTRITLALLLAVAGCTRLEDVSPGTLVTCAASAECPSGLVCTRGRCLSPSAIDTTPPSITGASVALAPGRIRAGQRFTMSFQVSEPLQASPDVSLALAPPPALSCAADAAALAYSCTYTATGLENAGAGGEVGVNVHLVDAAGNESFQSSVKTVTLDFAPPAPTFATVAYYPAPSNPLPAVSRAAAGTVVRVAVSPDQRVSADPAPALVARLGALEIPFDLVPGGLGDTDLLFQATIAGIDPDGVYTLAVRWTDDVGNTGTALVPATVAVKTSAPVLDVVQDAVVFVRSPFGNAAPEALGGYGVPPGAYFALEPSDPLSPATTLAAGAFGLAGGAAPSELIIQSSDRAGALVLGALRPDGGGRFPRQALSSPDLATVYVVGVDDAGNRSAPVKIRNAEWVATPSAPTSGTNPNTLLDVGYAASTRTQDLGAPADGPSVEAAGGADGRAMRASAEVAWRRRDPASHPPPRDRAALAYDAARGRAVLFGGYFYGGGNLQPDTWEWDGAGWTRVATTGPSARDLHAMVYDAARQRTVLFGGNDVAGVLSDTWEWSGSGWVQLATSGVPPARYGHAMAYDSARGRTVLFGGLASGAYLSDTWEWDGSDWVQVATTGPGARSAHAMAYDCARQRTVLFGGQDGAGGLADTWEWDGGRWVQVATTGPGARAGHALAYDVARARTVVHGGGGVADTWEWDGSAWMQIAAAGPSARSGHAMTYDGARRRTIVFGGFGTGYLSDTWQWDGSTWVQVALGTGGPPARYAHAMAHDGTRRRTVLFGGRGSGGDLGDTWEWNGNDWVQVATTGPGARSGHAMAYDPARNRTVLFGGAGSAGYLLDTWEWDGTSWRQVATTGPTARAYAALAHDGARHRTVLFGGSGLDAFGSTRYFPDTWEWDGSAWTQVATTGPGARYCPAMAYDGARARTVLFGSGAFTDTWEWSGTTWAQVATAGPTAREFLALAYDGGRGRTVVFGGRGNSNPLSDAWEWNGSSWAQLATTGPTARSSHAMAADGARARLVLFGGYENGILLPDTWELDAAPGRQPAIQLDAMLLHAGVPRAAFTAIRVRALAGGLFQPGGPGAVGATLHAWSNGYAAASGPGAWVRLAANGAGVEAQQPLLPTPSASLIDWQSASAAEVQRLITARDGVLSLQVRPAGSAGPEVAGAQVALDYIEVRVRYAVP